MSPIRNILSILLIYRRLRVVVFPFLLNHDDDDEEDGDDDEEEDTNANDLPDLEYVVHSPHLPAKWFYDSIDLVDNNTPSAVQYADDWLRSTHRGPPMNCQNAPIFVLGSHRSNFLLNNDSDEMFSWLRVEIQI